MLKNIYMSIAVMALLFFNIFSGDFLPSFTPLTDFGDANIDSSSVTGTVNLGDNSVINSIAIDNNNNIVAAGYVNVGFNTNFILARFTDEGVLDTTFNANGPQPGVIVTNALDITAQSPLNTGTATSIGNQAINNIVIDNNNNIVAVGYVNDGTNNYFTVARYTSAGVLDTTFNPTGIDTNVPGVLITNIVGGNAQATAVIIDSNNKIVVTGNSEVTGTSLPLQVGTNSTYIALVRYNNNGSLDTTLNPSGVASGQPGVVITNITGSPQTTITGNNNLAAAITIDNDEKILVGGNANITVTSGTASISETTGSLVIRYNTDGSLDTTFNAAGVQNGPPGSAITVVNNTDMSINNTNITTSIKIDNNNKIVLMGYSIFASNDAGQGEDIFIIRYNEDATFDTSFNPGALLPPFVEGEITTDMQGFPITANAGFIDNDNNIVIGGWISNQLSNFEVNPTNVGENDFFVIRFTSTGALDTTFNNLVTPGFVITSIPSNSAENGFLPNAQGNSMVLDSDNNIVLGGFSASGSEKEFTIARYTNAGILDTTFNSTGLVSNQPGVVILDALGGANPYNTLGVTLTLSTMTDVINLPNIAVDSERAAEISSFFVGYRRPIIDGPVEIFKEDNSNLVLTGSAHPHSIVHMSLNGSPAFSFKTNSEGSWLANLPALEDGNYHVYATTIDPTSHLAFSSNSVNVRVKTQSYIEPIINTPNVNQFFESEDIPTVGSAEPNAPVLLFLNSKFVGKTEASSAGSWEYQFNDLPDGKYFLNVVGLDNEGHINKKSPGVNFYVDRKPVNPKITTPKDNQKIDTDNIQVSGTAKPFAKVSFMINKRELPGTVTADNDGKWDVKLTDLSEQEYKLQAVAHGAKELASNVVSFNVTQPSKEESQKVAKQPENQEASQNAVGSINGKSNPNENIKLFMNGNPIADLQSSDEGIWNHPINFNNLQEGEHKVQYAVVDDNNKTQLIVEKPITVDNKQSW